MYILFWIRRQKQNSDGRVPIYCRITVNGTRSPDFSTTIFIKPELWNSGKQEIIGRDELSAVYNTKLNRILAGLEAIHLDFLVKGEAFNALKIREKFLGKTVQHITIVRLMEMHLEHYNGMVQREEKSKDTLRHMRNRFKLIGLYLSKTKQTDLLAKDVRVPLANGIEAFLKMEHEVKLGHNHVMKCLCFLKSSLSHGVNMGFLEHNPLAHYQTKMIRRAVKVFPDFNEIVKIYKYRFYNQTLANQAKVYVFECLTGLSYIDLKAFSLEPDKYLRISKSGRKYIDMNRGKNDQPFIVPLLPEAENILKSFDYKLPVVCNQVFNRILKEIAGIVGIEKNLTTKTARKAWGNILSEMEISLDSIGATYGHTSKTMTEQYYVQLSINRVLAEFEGKDVWGKFNSMGRN